MDKETEKEGVEVDRSNLARIVTEPFGDPIPGKCLTMYRVVQVWIHLQA